MAGSLVREAWKATGVAEASELRLTTTGCNACEIVCERLRDGAGAGAPAARGRRPRPGRNRHRSEGAPARGGAQPRIPRGRAGAPGAETVGPGSLRVILARLLVETQGAS